MNMTARLQGILLRPRDEWRAIDGEPTNATTLYRSYVVPLAAIGPVAAFISAAVFGASVPFVGQIGTPVGTALIQAIVSYALALVAPYVLALVAGALAPSFGAKAETAQALKLAVYSSTAFWLAGVFAIVPGLSFLSILGLYSLYLLYLGIPILMKVSAERALTYTVALVVVAAVIFIVIGAVTAAVTGLGAAV
jgi:hypothetical protein